MGRKVQIPERSDGILVVEDSLTQAEQLRHLLETHNYRSEVASNGSEALIWLRENKPLMVISDVLMPGVNGFELCKIIKKGKSTGNIPVILVTSLSDTEEVISGLKAGADSILTKPYSDEHLLSCVAKILDEYDKGAKGRESENVQINYGGRKRIIRTEPQKVINLLLDIYQGAIYQNERLVQVKEELRRLNGHLETLVKERTSDLTREIEVNDEITSRLQEDNEQILELNKKLMLSNRELERFAYVASHDLQEPLRMVSSYTQMLELRYGDKLDPIARDYINFAVDGAHRMYNLINGLLAYSRIQRRGSTYKTIDLNKTVEDVKKLLEIQITEKKAVIKADILPQIEADESQVIQLLQNLLSNALKFSIRAPRVYLTSKTEKDRYVISVRDEGIGIESQYFEKIFVIFQKLHSNDEYEGTGLGLAICKSIVEKHGGIIWVDSKPGRGSTFSFTIPLSRSPLPTAVQINHSSGSS